MVGDGLQVTGFLAIFEHSRNFCLNFSGLMSDIYKGVTLWRLIRDIELGMKLRVLMLCLVLVSG